jgi:WD40 repeat protein
VSPEVFVAAPAGSAPERILSESLAAFDAVAGITWHPDGQRVTFWGTTRRDREGGLWTLALSDGVAVRAQGSDEGGPQMKQAGVERTAAFRWAPDAKALYVAGLSKGVQNLWRVPIDPQPLRVLGGPERLTTGLGIDSDPAVSPDGTRLAFVVRTQTLRLWSVPFDPRARVAVRDGQPVTPATARTASFDLSADGKRLAFVAYRPGKATAELWSRSLDDGRETLLVEAPEIFAPRLSRDGAFVACRILRRRDPHDLGLAWISTRSGEERAGPRGVVNPWDWSPDGARFLHGCLPPEGIGALCTSPSDAPSTADARPMVADPDHLLWQGRFSPDGRWVSFTAESRRSPGVSIVGVVAASGGRWTPITEAAFWADKARWGPDGRTLYFISNRRGAFFDVWGIGFDPASGKPVGEAFRVTRYDDPGRTLTASALSELGVSPSRLVLPLTETTGSVWVLDGIQN